MSEQELKFGRRSAELRTLITSQEPAGSPLRRWEFLTDFRVHWIRPKRALFGKILRWILNQAWT